MGPFMLAAAILAMPAEADTAGATARICRNQEVIGSRLGARRICKTQAEWDEIDRVSRDRVREAQTRQVSPTVDRFPNRPNGY